ncbi:antitoxin MazE family protein [Thiospirillum jenense]|uniref:Antitoxin MazE family protein n=1 Tax=Thiospirillum jenense TaxID=1653858 RepID=A0A839HGA3_9GAMM|nr:antitoxin MazE family protein [Thiospirillum jenense]MBB1125352.1 antitoxin MazE family protein [Thiospirillum jenense]
MKTNHSTRLKQRHAALRAAGLRPIQLWLPNTRRAGFAEECRRQSLLLQTDAHEHDTIAWLEAIADRDGWQ